MNKEIWDVQESKEKLGKEMRVIQNTHKAPHSYSLFGKKTSDNQGQDGMCKESKGKLGEVKKVIPLNPLGILLIQPVCDEID